MLYLKKIPISGTSINIQKLLHGGLTYMQASAFVSPPADLEPCVPVSPPALKQAVRPPRHAVLDGWRGISILCVLAAHMLPLGPAFLRINECAAALGMVLFFTLSGFLITTTLMERANVRNFLIRRVCRIVPLAWLFALAALTLVHAPFKDYPATLLFYANLPPFWLLPITAHLWSLCLEMQFYMIIALIFGIFARRGLYLLPVLAVLVTILRMDTGTMISIVSYKRGDEILAGATLALIYGRFHNRPLPRLLRFLPVVLLPLTLAACHPLGGWMSYLRPYLGAALVGSTLFFSDTSLAGKLRARWLVYLAEISYSLYVLHAFAMTGWFEPASKLLKYARRPIGLSLTFLLAHCSTRYFESFWIAQGKRWTRTAKVAPVAAN